MRVRLWLQTIDVDDEGTRLGRTEPFLWPLFFRLDADTLRHLAEPPAALAEGPVWLVAPDGAHRNLGGAYHTGDSIGIPGALGRVVFELDSGGLLSNAQTRVGFLAALLEEEIFPSHATIVREYAHFASTVEEILREQLAAELSDVQLAAFRLERPARSAEDTPSLTFAAARDIRALLSRWKLGGDDLVGVRSEVWSMDDLEARPHRTLSTRWATPEGSRVGRYRLEGEVQAEVAAVGTPSAFVWSVDRSPLVAFRSEGHHIHQLGFDGSGWNHQDLSHLARGEDRAWPVAAAGDPVCLTRAEDHAQHVLYRGEDDHIHELLFRGGWQHRDLSALAGAPAAAGNPAAWLRPTDGSSHMAFRGRDGHIHEIWHHHGRHHHRDITLAAAGAPNALGDPAAFVRHGVGQQVIVFRGADGHHHLLRFDGEAWRHDDLHFSANAPVAASDPVVLCDDETGLLALIYRSAMGHVSMLVHEADTWNPVDLSHATRATASTGRPTACLSEGAIFVAWRSLEGHIHATLGEGTHWEDKDLCQLTGCAVRAASDPVAFSGGRDKALHVVFRGVDRHMHALSHIDGWRHTDLTLAARIGFAP